MSSEQDEIEELTNHLKKAYAKCERCARFYPYTGSHVCADGHGGTFVRPGDVNLAGEANEPDQATLKYLRGSLKHCSQCGLAFSIWEGHECAEETFPGLNIEDGEEVTLEFDKPKTPFTSRVQCANPNCANIIEPDHARVVNRKIGLQFCCDYCASEYKHIPSSSAPATIPEKDPIDKMAGLIRDIPGPIPSWEARFSISEEAFQMAMRDNIIITPEPSPWTCPRCDRVWGPGVKGCEVCNNE